MMYDCLGAVCNRMRMVRYRRSLFTLVGHWKIPFLVCEPSLHQLSADLTIPISTVALELWLHLQDHRIHHVWDVHKLRQDLV